MNYSITMWNEKLGNKKTQVSAPSKFQAAQKAIDEFRHKWITWEVYEIKEL